MTQRSLPAAVRERTVPDVLAARAAQTPERIALIAPSLVAAGEVRLGYGALRGRAGRLAAGLAAVGVGKGDRVGIWAPNVAEWTLNHHATSNSTTEARNQVAADLTDPDFVQPVRTLTSVGRGNRYEEDRDLHYDDDDTADLGVLGDFDGDVEAEGDEFLRHPDPEEKPAPAKRKVRRSSVNRGRPACGSAAMRMVCSVRCISQACTTAAANRP